MVGHKRIDGKAKMERKSFKESFTESDKNQKRIDYKSPVTLYHFISEGGKINPARITLLICSEQRVLRNAVKKARRLSLLPSSAQSYDIFGYPEQISATPFEID